MTPDLQAQKTSSCVAVILCRLHRNAQAEQGCGLPHRLQAPPLMVAAQSRSSFAAAPKSAVTSTAARGKYTLTVVPLPTVVSISYSAARLASHPVNLAQPET